MSLLGRPGRAAFARSAAMVSAVAVSAALAAPQAFAGTHDGAIARATANVKEHAAQTKFDATQAVAATDVVVDADGTEHVRLDRTVHGLRVIGGDLVVHQRPSGELLGLSQTLRLVPRADASPALGKGNAIQTAASMFEGTPTSGQADLVVYARGADPTLAYEAVVTGTKSDGVSPSELHVVVDALFGRVLDSWDAIESVAGTGRGFFSGTVPLQTTTIRGGFRLQDPTRGNQFTCDMRNGTSSCFYMNDADNVWGDFTLGNRQSVAVDAQYGTAVTWDYYRTVHGRNGIANDGRGSYNRVHYSSRYNNAFWSDSCFCMTYGDGDGTTFNPFDSLDVAGHEMTHGVTSRTARLVYSGESGGLNESTSDIFGTAVEAFAANPKDPADFAIGERLYRSNPSGSRALRYMWNPGLDGRSANCWSSSVGSLDVHYSSGVGNHFFYLLSQGSNANPASPTCNSSTVTGVGLSTAARIWYRALTVYMTSSTNYHGARTASLDAARDLYGTGSAQYNAVNAAWAAVSVT
jgi:Zn-dependent metalloprotease